MFMALIHNPFFPQVNLGYPPPGTRLVALSVACFLVMDILLIRFLLGRAGRRSNSARPLWQGAAAGIGWVLVFFLGLEVVLRLYISSLPPRPSLPDPGVFWRLNPLCHLGDRSYNHHGLREREIPAARPPGQWRVLVMGDSSIYGDQVREEETFSRRLEVLEKAAHPGLPLVVINGGIPGYSSFQGVEWLRRCLAYYHPNLVILAYFNSDVVPDVVADSARVPAWGPARRVRELLFHSQVFLWLRREAAVWRVTHPPAGSNAGESSLVVRVSPGEYRRNLETMIRMCRQADAKAVLLNLPPDRSLPPQPRYRDILRQTAAQEGAPLVDIAGRWAAADSISLYADNVHPNAAGHLAIAGQIFHFLEDQGLGPGAGGPARPAEGKP